MEVRRETHELTIIRPLQTGASLFCEICGSHIAHFRIGQTASVLSISETAAFRLAENGLIHSNETPFGTLMLCVNSITVIARQLRSTESIDTKDLP